MKNVNYIWNNDSDDSLNLAFDKKNSDLRKEWLSNYDKQNILDYTNKQVTFNDFINKDLVHFSKYDVERSIPSLIDGLKISQRKILHACFKKNLTSEIKVAQLAGYVSEVTDYLHGETSLQMAIVGMAQDYTGSNNINFLSPNGQFGTRIHQGKDAAQARYIFTELSKITFNIFKPQDKNILNYLNEEGHLIEPEYFIPIIPTILVNGAIGIGTGFSTNIPCFNPKDLISLLNKLLDNQDISDQVIHPWYRGFKGTIEFDSQNKYISKGIYAILSKSIIQVSELPIGVGTQDFKNVLEDLIEKSVIKDYKNQSTDSVVLFTITFPSEKSLQDVMSDIDKFESLFKLVSYKNMSISNMYAFDENGCIHKYKSVIDIIEYFYHFRLKNYVKRKEYLLKVLEHQKKLHENKIRFLTCIISRELDISKMSKKQLEKRLEELKYYKSSENDSSSSDSISGVYDYLVCIPIYNMTMDKLESIKVSLDKTNSEISLLKDTSVKDIWKSELKELSLCLS